MSFRTVEISSIEEFLAYEDESLDVLADQETDRNRQLLRFPHSVMLKVSFAELDFANRWCWQQFGPCDGECKDKGSEYRVCNRDEPHSHEGPWTWDWFGKTDYNFGFNEWYFKESADRDRFLANVEMINWGEKYPK